MLEPSGVRNMLAERVIEWTQEWKRQGLDEGRKDGRKQGESLIRRALTVEFHEKRGQPPRPCIMPHFESAVSPRTRS